MQWNGWMGLLNPTYIQYIPQQARQKLSDSIANIIRLLHKHWIIIASAVIIQFIIFIKSLLLSIIIIIIIIQIHLVPWI